MIAFALIASLLGQDTNTVISPRVRAMLEHFPPPHSGLPSIAIQFSRDTVWLGEQVELVTATWFPLAVRNRLRRSPTINAPLLAGVWIARNQQLPIPVGTRAVGNQVYELYVAWQSIFPLGPGTVTAPPATLLYNLPTSTAYFAPEEKKVVASTPAALVVRAIPSLAAATLGAGPTARNLRIAWRGTVNGLHAGAPAIVELVVTGDGNLTLWPAPTIDWPAAVHVYPEPTLELPVPAQGLISGEKRFRFTLVADSAGVLTLPIVRYPYFDPAQVQVVQPIAAAVTLPILERSVAASDRRSLTVIGGHDVQVAALIVRGWWVVLVGTALLPIVIIIRRGRRRMRVLRPPGAGDPEAQLRAALGTPVDAGQDHVIAALRLRGVPRDEAEHIHRWLSALGRRRYGPTKAELPDPPPVIMRVIARLRGPATIAMLLLAALPLHAQLDDGVARFAGGDYPGAARAFEREARAEPAAAGVWRDLGAARWMQHDDVGAASAWLNALALAPRDPLLRDDWNSAASVPADVRARAPAIPLSRDEFVLLGWACWLIAGLAIARRWHRTGWIAGALCAGSLFVVAIRWNMERPGQALVATSTVLRISPHPATMAVGEVAAWSIVRVKRRVDNWVLVGGQVNASGSAPGLTVEGWVPAASIAPIGPLD